MSKPAPNLLKKAYFLPGLPHILLAPEKNEGWMKVRKAFDVVQKEIEALDVDVILLYSTYWPSVLGHQIQANPNPKWIHVDEVFHDLGSIPYDFKVDTEVAAELKKSGDARGLHCRLVNYEGFPIDTGSLVVLKLINPKNKIPVVICSSNVYSDRAETIIFGKAARDACEKLGKKAVAISVSSLSNRLHQSFVDPKDDKISSLKDQEWNQKFLEFLSEGRLEDVSQLSRQFHKEARVHKVNNFKAFWWLAAVMGQNNLYSGKVYEYQPIVGTGNAVVGLTPSDRAARDLEFDESDPEKFQGERNVLDSSGEDFGLDPFAERADTN